MYYIFFIHSSTDGHLGCSDVLTMTPLGLASAWNVFLLKVTRLFSVLRKSFASFLSSFQILSFRFNTFFFKSSRTFKLTALTFMLFLLCKDLWSTLLDCELLQEALSGFWWLPLPPLSGFPALSRRSDSLCRKGPLGRPGGYGPLLLSGPSSTDPRGTTFPSGRHTGASRDVRKRGSDDFASKLCSDGGAGRVPPGPAPFPVSRKPFSKFQTHPE